VLKINKNRFPLHFVSFTVPKLLYKGGRGQKVRYIGPNIGPSYVYSVHNFTISFILLNRIETGFRHILSVLLFQKYLYPGRGTNYLAESATSATVTYSGPNFSTNYTFLLSLKSIKTGFCCILSVLVFQIIVQRWPRPIHRLHRPQCRPRQPRRPKSRPFIYILTVILPFLLLFFLE
jgi:hypothetical protein